MRLLFCLSSSLLWMSTTTVVVQVQAADSVGEIDYSDPLIGKKLVHFDVTQQTDTLSELTCIDRGARCVLRKSHFQFTDFGSGQASVNEQGSVWASTKSDAILSLGHCIEEPCIVTCNANCTCVYSERSTAEDVDQDNDSTATNGEGHNVKKTKCTQVSSRAPTVAPAVDTTLTKCPKQQFNTEFCYDLMNSRGLPAGNVDNYDCFNFCGGIFVSACDLTTGNCGILTCENATATGTRNGHVYGCTKSDMFNPPPGYDDTGKQSSSPCGGLFSSVIMTWSIMLSCLLSVIGASIVVQ